MSPVAKIKLIKQMKTILQQTATGAKALIQRVAATLTSEGGWSIQRVVMPPQVTTSTNPMNKKEILEAPRRYMCPTKNNNHDMLPPIEMEASVQHSSIQLNPELSEARSLATTLNWSRIPFVLPNIISKK